MRRVLEAVRDVMIGITVFGMLAVLFAFAVGTAFGN
jgi:hypothetical protein